MSVPDGIAALVGYRTWALGLGQLWSPLGPGRERWPRTEPLRALCLRHGVPSLLNPRIPEHAAPDQCCTCGIYAVFDPWDLEFEEQRIPWALVAGRVEGWGRVALGARGFRSELARPRQLFAELWWDGVTRRAAASAARAYGIPLVSWENLADAECTARLSGVPPVIPGRPILGASHVTCDQNSPGVAGSSRHLAT